MLHRGHLPYMRCLAPASPCPELALALPACPVVHALIWVGLFLDKPCCFKEHFNCLGLTHPPPAPSGPLAAGATVLRSSWPSAKHEQGCCGHARAGWRWSPSAVTRPGGLFSLTGHSAAGGGVLRRCGIGSAESGRHGQCTRVVWWYVVREGSPNPVRGTAGLCPSIPQQVPEPRPKHSSTCHGTAQHGKAQEEASCFQVPANSLTLTPPLSASFQRSRCRYHLPTPPSHTRTAATTLLSSRQAG